MIPHSRLRPPYLMIHARGWLSLCDPSAVRPCQHASYVRLASEGSLLFQPAPAFLHVERGLSLGEA
jgi:hypothetical protein